MRRMTCASFAVTVAFLAMPAIAADRPITSDKSVGTTTLRPPVPLDSEAMNAMLRADRDKDGTVSREELEHYDLGLARRFKEVDADRDGKLTLYEFEKLLSPEQAVSRR